MGYTERYVCNYSWTVQKTDGLGNTYTETKTCDVEAIDAHTIIEVEAIVDTCSRILEQITDVNKVNQILYDCANSSITKNELCIDGVGIENILAESNSDVLVKVQSIANSVDNIKNGAIEKFNMLQEKYNNIAKEQCASRHDK